MTVRDLKETAVSTVRLPSEPIIKHININASGGKLALYPRGSSKMSLNETIEKVAVPGEMFSKENNKLRNNIISERGVTEIMLVSQH